MDAWKGKTCLITGSSSGLGLELARQLARRGARLALNGRHVAPLKQAAQEIESLGAEVITLPGDVTIPELASQLVEQTIAQFGQLDLVCHAAGRSMRGHLLDCNHEEFEALWRLNTCAAVDLARAAQPHLLNTQGHLVLIGSLASRVAPRFLGGYPASKFPLTAIAQQLRLELGPAGLHTLLVCPGPIARPDGEQRYQQQAAGLPPSAARPGGGAKVRTLDPAILVTKILVACERRQPELILPAKARLLFLLNQLSASWGDWLLQRKTS